MAKAATPSNEAPTTPSKTAVSAAIVAMAQSMASSAMGGLMLTREQGAEIVGLGFAEVDASVVDGDKAFVSLTPEGEAMLKENGGTETTGDAGTVQPGTNVAASVAAVAKTGGIRGDIPPPTKNRRGRKGGSIYPLETMEINESFHIPVSKDNPDPASRIASSLTNARLKYAVPVEPAQTETVTQKVYKRGEDGKVMVDAEGKRIVESTQEITRPVTKVTRDWIVAAVDASDPDGVGARVWRVS